MLEEEEPPLRRSRLATVVLDTMGVDELQSYIGELQGEILRVEGAIDRKRGHRDIADGFFRR